MTDRAEAQLAAYTARGLTETVTYRPRGGRARTLEAVIRREGRDDQLRAAVPAIRAAVVNDVTLGIELSEIDTGGDTLSVAARPGGTVATRRITDIVDEETDAEWVTVTVR